MEKLMSMVTILAWVFTVVLPIIVIGTTIKQKEYDGSLSESIDAMSGIKASYTHNNLKFIILWVISVIYLIA